MSINIKKNALNVKNGDTYDNFDMFFLGDVGEVVDEWFEEHPDGAVPDGSLTESKFSDELILKTVKDYVTPEMFGAVGDGVTDDTQAFQNMFDSGKTVLSLSESSVYKLTSSIFVPSRVKSDVTILGKIQYTGNDYAIKFTCSTGRVTECNLRFGDIVCLSGGAIYFSPNDENNGYVAGCRISGRVAHVSTSIIKVVCSDDGWFNENYIEDFNCESGDYFCYIDMPDTGDSSEVSRLTFERVHIEGVSNGVYVDANGHGYSNIQFRNCRINESIPGHYCYIANGFSSNSVLNYIINVDNPFFYNTRNKFGGDAIYCISNIPVYRDSLNRAYPYDGFALWYKGVFLNPPLTTPIEITISNNSATVDMSNGIFPIKIDNGINDVIVNITIPVFLPDMFSRIPFVVTGTGLVTFKVNTQTGEQTRTFKTDDAYTISEMLVNYVRGLVYFSNKIDKFVNFETTDTSGQIGFALRPKVNNVVTNLSLAVNTSNKKATLSAYYDGSWHDITLGTFT